jgi:hypothetical protein
MNKKKLLSPTTLYPLTVLWLLGASLAVAVSMRGGVLAPGLIVLGFVALVGMQVACRKELIVVHILVNQQHDELVHRVNQLVEALQESDVPVPKATKVNH